jgi:hypothetical protein
MQPADMQTILARTSHPRLEEWSSPRPHSPRSECCAVPHTLSRRHATIVPCRTRRAIDNNADVRQARLSHSTICPCSRERVSEPGPLPSGDNGVLIGRTIQHIVCAERHSSRICPAHPRSLARCFSRARRHLAFCFAWARTTARQCAERFWPMRPAGFGFQKIFVATNAKRFSEPSEKDTPAALGSGTHSHRFAQE